VSSGSGTAEESKEREERGSGVSEEARERGELLDKVLDHVMLRLRLSAGLDLAEMSATFGADSVRKVLCALEPHLESGRAVVDVPKQYSGGVYTPGEGCVVEGETVARGVVRLSDPEGFLVSNDIISSVFAELDES